MDGDDLPDRLRALLTLMREFGVTKIVTPGGTHIERPHPSTLEAAAADPPENRDSAAAPKAEDPDDLDEIDRADREEKRLEDEWNACWARHTRSSGSSIPKYPGAEKARRFLGRWA